MRSYIIKIWENEDLREKGISDIIEIGISKIELAVERARDIQEKNNYAYIEVQDESERISYYMNNGIEEKLYEREYLNAIKQEKINHLYNLIYNNKEIVYINEDMIGKAGDILNELENNEENIISEFEDDSETIKKEFQDLKKDILEYDKDDIIKVYEHPMTIIPMLDSENRILEDMRETFLSMIELKVITNFKIEDVVDSYMGYNDIYNFMEYGSDREVYTNPTFTKLYKELLDLLDVKYENIYTEDVSDGKYETTIELKNGKELVIDTSGWSEIEIITNNLRNIMEEYKKQLDNKLKIVYKEVGKEPIVMEIEDTLEAKQKLVGGLIEVIPYKEDLLLVCNEEGKILNLKPNLRFPNDYIVGNCFIVGDDSENASFKSIKDEQIEKIESDLKNRTIELDEEETEEADMEF